MVVCQSPGYKGIRVRGTRVFVSWVQGYSCPGYEGNRVRGTRVFVSGVRGYSCPGIRVRGTKVNVSGVRGYSCPGYDGMGVRQSPKSGVRGYARVRGTRVCQSPGYGVWGTRVYKLWCTRLYEFLFY